MGRVSHRPRQGVVIAIATLASLPLLGCGGGVPPASSTMAQAQVKGKVTVHGKPLKTVEVNFNPANINRQADRVTARSGDDGAYEVTTLLGENVVTLSGPAVGHSPQLQYFSRTYDVKDGDNSFDIDIP